MGSSAHIATACAVSLALTLSCLALSIDSPIVDRPVLFSLLRAGACLGLLAIAMTVVLRGGGERLAVLLVATATVWSLNALTTVDAPWPFLLGRIAVAASVLLVAYVTLSYPSGRLDMRASEAVMRVFAVGTLTLLTANLLLSQYPPVAGPFVRCSDSACPPNPLAIAGVGERVSHALSSAFGLWTAAIVAVVAVLIARRARLATPLQRRSLGPVLAWALLMSVGYALYVAVRAVDPESSTLTAASVIVAVAVALMPVAIAFGMVRGRVFAIGGLERMFSRLGGRVSPRILEQSMADAFGDPGLRLLVREPDEGRYVDVRGEPVDVGPASSRVTPIDRDGRPVAVLLHDPALSEEPEVMDAVGSALLIALENASLEAELEESQERVVRAADDERQRIERDLHDGAQQQLVALRIKLAMLEERAAADPAAVAPELGRAGLDIESALEQIRLLARGVYPPELRDFGIAGALRAVTRGLPVEVAVQDMTKRRFPSHVETAVYFCCAEALQNVVKHAGPKASAEVRLSLRRGSELVFVVCDEGVGFDPHGVGSTGQGLRGMAERLRAVGGRVTIDSTPGAGVVVTGLVPL